MRVQERPDVELTPSDLAMIQNWSRWTAWRRMEAIHRRHPEHVVRKGRTLVAKASVLAQYIPGLKTLPIEREAMRLNRRIVDLELQLRAEASARIELKNELLLWITRVQSLERFFEKSR